MTCGFCDGFRRQVHSDLRQNNRATYPEWEMIVSPGTPL